MNTPRILALSIASLLLTRLSATAVTFFWDGGSAVDSNIGTPDNWNPNAAPASNLATTDLVFDGTLRLNPNFLAGFSANGLIFNNNAAANPFVFGGAGLTVGATGIVNNDANTQTFGNTVSLGTASTTFNAASGALIFNGALGLGNSTLNVNGAATTTLGTVNGTGTINKSGGGTLSLQPVTTHVFDLVQSAGSVQTLAGGTTQFNAGSVVQINGGTFSSLGNLTLDGGVLTRAAAGFFTLASGAALAAQNSAVLTFNGAQNFNGGQALTVGSGSQLASTSYLDLGNAGTGNTSLQVTGTGSLVQTAQINDWGRDGGTASVMILNLATSAFNGGLRLAESGATGSGTLDIGSGATVTTSSLRIGASTAGALGTVNIFNAGSKLTVTGVGATTIGAATGAAQSLSFFSSGSFESGTGALTIGATGTLNANGNFLANGDIVVNGVFNRTGLAFALTPGKNLTVQGGGDANLFNLTVPASSTATFTGAGSTYTGGTITTAAANSALSVSAGAVLNVNSGTALSATNGSMFFDGAGTQFIGSNAFVSAVGGVINGAAGTATVTFRNNAAGTFGTFIDVAAFGSPGSSGTFNVLTGADLSVQGFSIGSGADHTGVVTVDGVGSTVTQTGNSQMQIGRFDTGSGTLNVSNGASFTTSAAAFTFVNATGALSLTGAGSTFTANGSMTVRGQVVTGVGTNFTLAAALSVADGGDVTFGKRPNFSDGATITVSGAGSTLGTAAGSGAELALVNNRLDVTAGGIVQSAREVDIVGTSQVVVDGLGSQLNAAPSSLSIWGGSAVADFTVITFRNGAVGTFGEVEIDQSFTPEKARIAVESGADLTLAGLRQDSFGVATAEFAVSGMGSTLTVTTSGITLGAATARAGTLNISGGAVVTLAATGTNRLVLNPTGTVNLAGGTLALGEPITRLGGVMNFTAGALFLAEDLTVGSAGLVGPNFTLTAAKQLTTPGLTQIEPFNTLTLDGGALTTGTLANSGTLDFKKGMLTVTGAGGFNIGTGALGANVTLGTGANLQVTNTATIASGATLTVNGGTFTTGPLANSGTIRAMLGTASVTSGTNNSGGRIFIGDTFAVSGAFTNASAARITLQDGTGVLSGAGTLNNSGLVTGDGTIAKPLTNGTTGEVRGELGRTLTVTGATINSGTFNLLGGTLEFTGTVTNSAAGFISGHGALFTGGLTNAGVIAVSGGNMDIRGDTTLTAGARVATSGASAITTFFDDVVHNGLEIFTGAGASTVFYGSQSGAGSFTGTGTVYYIGDLRPGNSPASVLYEGDLVFGGTSTLTLEIGGLTAGSGYDKVNVGGTLYEDGVLDVVLYGGFLPAAGASFDLIDAGAVAGAFDAVNLPALGSGLSWDTSQLSANGTVSVVPEPTSATLLLCGTAFLGLRRRR